MRKAEFWKTDWFPGLVAGIAMLGATRSDLVSNLGASVQGPALPPWGEGFQYGVLLLVVAYLMLLLPRLSTLVGFAVSAIILGCLATGSVLAFPLVSSMILVVLGHLLLAGKRLVSSARSPAMVPKKPKSSPILTTTPAPIPAPPSAGTVAQTRATIGPYRIEKALGKGAMGVVYRARDEQNGRPVAIKTMALSQAFDESELVEVKERFFREAETAKRLDHPNIVALYEAGEDRGLAYIALEFIKGCDLGHFVTPGSLLPLPQVLSILARVADALAYSHGKNVVHRDVKPANVMYEPESDTVKVMDFGIARITDASKTRTGMVLGTPSYMSPEQLLGKKVDGRSDLFSLGVMLYQMLCGRRPFVSESMAQLMFQIANEAHPDIRGINPLVPEGLAAVIDRAMSKDVEKRYQSGEDMARDLRACMHQAPAQRPDVDIEL